MAQPSIGLCLDGHLAMLEEGTHWVHHEDLDRVNVLIDAFLRHGRSVGQTSRPGFRAQRQWRLTLLSVKNVRRLTMRGKEIAKLTTGSTG
jgi:hypothetical protein